MLSSVQQMFVGMENGTKTKNSCEESTLRKDTTYVLRANQR